MKCALLISFISISLSVISQSATIYFDSDRFSLTDRGQKKLDSVISLLKTSGTDSVSVAGHCDRHADDAYNDVLAANRAKTVADYFQSAGIKAKTSSFGKRKMLSTGETPGEDAVNRMVEITWLPIQIAGDTVTKKDEIREDRISDLLTIDVGKKIILHNINFEGGRHIFLPSAEAPSSNSTK